MLSSKLELKNSLIVKKILEKILMRPKMMFIEIMKNLTANSMIEVK